MEPRGSRVSPLRTRKRSKTLELRKTTLGSRSGRSNGWAECREKKIGIEPMGSTFFLTSPLIGHCYTEEIPGRLTFCPPRLHGIDCANDPFFGSSALYIRTRIPPVIAARDDKRRKTMRGAVITEFGKPLEVQNLPDPEPGPGDAIVQTEACGICRSDWHMWQHHWTWLGIELELPRIPGHEFGGRVVEVG